MRALGGRGKHKRSDALQRNRIGSASSRREDMEKRAIKSKKLNGALFGVSEAANQNQKFPFHFLSAPPTPPAENIKKGRKIFGFVPRPQGADEARITPFVQNRFAQSVELGHQKANPGRICVRTRSPIKIFYELLK